MQRTPTLRRLARLARPELPSLILGTFALLVGAAANLSYPVFVRQLLDGIDAGQTAVNHSALTLLLLFLVTGIFTGLRAWLFTVAGERVVSRLRAQLYSTLIRQEVAFFDEQRTGELTSRLASDTTVLQNAVTVNISMALRFGVLALGGVVMLFVTSWRLTGLALAVVPAVVAGAAVYGRAVRKVSREVQDALARATEVAEETLSGIRTVRAFAREDAESARYQDAVQRSFELARRRAGMGAIFGGGMAFAGYAAVALVLWYGGSLLVAGRMTIGELTSFVLYTFTVAFGLGALSSVWEDLVKALGAGERVFELLERTSTVVSGDRRLERVEGVVRLEEVVFAYPSRADVPVLDGVSLELRRGEVVALVGHSGAGKSTVAALLSRFYDPQGGTIRLDGEDLRDLDASWLREQVGVVSQEPILFATTVGDNIRYGRPTASQAEVEAAARAAHAHGFISTFPEGYKTLVGERGVRLSGGQKQRVAIARAILKDPRVLILDEATSALDAESEHLVQEALRSLMTGRTTLVIAHRLSTVKEADRVVVLDRGRVVQSGPHGQLVSEDGIYRQLVARQFAA